LPKKRPLPGKRSQPAEAGSEINSQNAYGVWLFPKLKNILAKRLTTLGRVDTLIKRQKGSGSLNRQLKVKNKGKKLNLEKRIV
jgi:hypothetical protein